VVGHVIALFVLIVVAHAATYVVTLDQRRGAVRRWASSAGVNLHTIRPLWGRSFFCPAWSVYFEVAIEGRATSLVAVGGPIRGCGVTEV
jgi:hypothetical protein